jgi:DNA invertase Pin-like site-specific DNA recombinase
MPPIAYLRKSVVRVDDPHNSAEAQEAAVRALAARHGQDGAELVVLADWDRSGRLGRAGRPGYDALWRAIETGQATAIYSYSMSRLARSVAELSKLFEACRQRTIPVRLVADSVDTSTASGRMLAHVLADVAEFEADVAGERLRAALAAKRARGERIGTAPFYGDRDGEDTEAVLAAFREAGSFSGAAKLLNARGIKTAGRARLNRKAGEPYRQVWWPSAVAQVVRRLDPKLPALRPTRGYKAGGTNFILARLLRCPTCGTMLTGTRDRDGRRVRYSCRLGTATPHPRISVTEAHILPAIQAEADRYHVEPLIVIGGPEPESEGPEVAAKRRALETARDLGAIDAETFRELAARLTPPAIDDPSWDEDWLEDAVRLLPPDWSAEPAYINRGLHMLWARVELDPVTFQPLGFEWRRPEWRQGVTPQ